MAQPRLCGKKMASTQKLSHSDQSKQLVDGELLCGKTTRCDETSVEQQVRLEQWEEERQEEIEAIKTERGWKRETCLYIILDVPLQVGQRTATE